MDYYCNICKKPITKDVFRYSMNKFKRPLCPIHQGEQLSVHTQDKLSETTKSLQSMMKRRQQTISEINQGEQEDSPKSIKDWINADIETWDHVLKKSKIQER